MNFHSEEHAIKIGEKRALDEWLHEHEPARLDSELPDDDILLAVLRRRGMLQLKEERTQALALCGAGQSTMMVEQTYTYYTTRQESNA